MPFLIRLSPEAVRDIDEVLRFTAENFGDRKCDQYRDLIRDALAELSQDPFSIRSKARPEIHSTVRTFHIGRRGRKARHILVYRCGKSGVITIARMLHDAMDLGSHLPRDFDSD